MYLFSLVAEYSSSTVSLMPFKQNQVKAKKKEGPETTKAGCNVSNFLLS